MDPLCKLGLGKKMSRMQRMQKWKDGMTYLDGVWWYAGERTDVGDWRL